MTEAEWLACADPMEMFKVVNPPLSRRVAVLFGAACIRVTPWAEEQSLLQRARQAVERAADGSAGWEEVDLLNREAESVCHNIRRSCKLDSPPHFWALATYRLTSDSVLDCWMHVPFFLIKAVAQRDESAAKRLREVSARLLRDIAGSPFQGGRGPDLLLRSEWGTPTVLGLAGEAYESADFSTVPILADALEDAGCTESRILEHLRGPGPHVRGCWVIDGLLGKS